RRMGVRFQFGARVVGLDCVGARLVGATVAGAEGGWRRIEADHYVAALPVEQMRPLCTEAMKNADPRLAGLDHLSTEWMTGVQFFLDVPLPVVPGHLVLAGSPWAVTAISQAQFWPRTDLGRFGDGRVRGVLSAIIANWQAVGTHVRKPAQDCT